MEEIIKAYLDSRAASDPLFAEKYKNPKKSIAECIQFILGEAQSQAVKIGNTAGAFMDDTEVFGLAVHYYDEENIEIKKINGQCIPEFHGATYEPTDEDRENAKKAALKRLEEEAIKELHKPKKKVETTADNQQSLF